MDDNGQPATFVAQFCFTDSTDVVPPLPGEVLLVFLYGDSTQGIRFDRSCYTEWSPVELRTPGFAVP